MKREKYIYQQVSLFKYVIVGLFVSLLCQISPILAQETMQLYPKITRMEGQGNGGNWLDLTQATRDRIMSGAPWKTQNVEYENGSSPVKVRVYNPAELKDYDYRLKLLPQHFGPDTNMVPTNVITDSSLVSNKAHWILEWWQNDTLVGSYISRYTLGEGTEEFVEGHGIAITFRNSPFMIYDENLKRFVEQKFGGNTYANNAYYTQPNLIGSTVQYSGQHAWLGGLQDVNTDVPANWIRSGKHTASNVWECISGGNSASCFYYLWRKEDFFNLYLFTTNYSYAIVRGFMDCLGQFGHIASGTWAPYMMSSPYDGGPKANYYAPDIYLLEEIPSPNCYDFTKLSTMSNRGGYNQTLTNLYSVDIVMTPDTNLWTRALVLEAGSACEKVISEEDSSEVIDYKVAQNFNGQTYYNLRHEPKTCPSVDKQGRVDNSGTTGFGWFPGYAINVETGERLNIMFAENSADEYNHGNDMLFNPTNVYAFRKDTSGALVLDANGHPIPMSQAEYDSLYLDIYEEGNFSYNYLGEPLNGGKHYVYVCGSSGNTANLYYYFNNCQRSFNDNYREFVLAGQTHGNTFIGTDGVTYPYYECGVYDEGKWLSEKFKTFASEENLNDYGRKVRKMQVFNNVMWTGIPMPEVGEESHWLEDEVTVKIRVTRPYMFYTSAVGTGPDVVVNENAPMFVFNTTDLNMASETPIFDVNSLIEGQVGPNRMDVNNIDAPIYPNSSLRFYDLEADYKYPKGSEKATNYAFAYWLGGLDEQDSLHVMAEQFQLYGYDSWAGPLSTVDAHTDKATVAEWKRTFKITREDIVEFLDNYQDTNYTIPRSIREWPAHGDPLKGQAWNLAPFVDVNNNNVYEPSEGDYPDFPGDMAIFFIFNDNYKPHTESGGKPLGVEVHCMVYAYYAPDDSLMNNTIFYNYKIFNRSQHDYHDAYVGLWDDWDLGYCRDDYVACDIMKNSAYCYNATDIDGNGENNAYGANWPVQTITLLSGPLMPADGQDNPAYTDSSDCSLFINNGLNEYAINGTSGFGDGVVDNERYGLTGFVYHNNDNSVTGDPHDAAEYYGLMSGYWKDGSHIKYGANGHTWIGSSDIDCRFMFPGNHYPCNYNTYGVEIPDSLQYFLDGWLEDAVNPPHDVRGLSSIGPFNLEAGGMQEMEFAMVTIPHSIAMTRGNVSLNALGGVNQNYHEKVFTPAITYITNATVCEGEIYTFFGQECDASGQYSYFIPNSRHDIYLADTVYLLYLTVQPLYSVVYAEVKPGHAYHGNGFNISSSETAEVGVKLFLNTFTSSIGCDSTVVLLLDIREDAQDNPIIEPQGKLIIYPNPTANYVTVVTDDEELVRNGEKLMVFDLQGRLLYARPIQDFSTTIDMTSYRAGTYIVKLGKKAGKVVRR